MKPVIEARGLCKSFGAITAARDVTVSFDRGTISGLIGANGAGKTTFINMVTGYLKPDSGSILLENENLAGLPPREVVARGLSRSFQIPQVFNSLTAAQNLCVAYSALRTRGIQAFRMMPDAALSDRARGTLARFGLTPFADTPAAGLPEGIRKLLDIAMALVSEPKAVFLDEPTSGVSSEEKFVIMDRVIDAAKAANVTVLFVEHDMEIVRRYSDRVIAFAEGSILMEGRPESVLGDVRVRAGISGEDIAVAAHA